jgi:LCP family protein required for cell wall assembly
MCSARVRTVVLPLSLGLALGVGAGFAWLLAPAQSVARAPVEGPLDAPIVLAPHDADGPPVELAPPSEPREAVANTAHTPRTRGLGADAARVVPNAVASADIDSVADPDSDSVSVSDSDSDAVSVSDSDSDSDSVSVSDSDSVTTTVRDPSAPHDPLRVSHPTRAAPAPDFDAAETYLLAGIDRTRSGGFGRADTLVVAVFDDASGHVGLVSIPRDLLVDVPGHGLARINATLRIAGRLGRDPIATLRTVVGDVLGFTIDHAILGDLDVFERTVDALGGVHVDVPCAMRDDFLDPRTESGRRLLDVPAGRVRMDGATAAMYARSRHGRSDWDRARRQQALLFAMRGRVRELGAAAWLPVLHTASAHVATDLSRLELLALVRRVADVREDRLHGILLGHREVVPTRTAEGQWVVQPDEDAIARALEGLFDAAAPGVPHVRARCQPVDAALRPRRTEASED